MVTVTERKLQPAESGPSGSSTGSADSGSGRARPSASYTIGNGSPQYRCLAKSQSRSLYSTRACPRPSVASRLVMASFAEATLSPFR